MTNIPNVLILKQYRWFLNLAPYNPIDPIRKFADNAQRSLSNLTTKNQRKLMKCKVNDYYYYLNKKYARSSVMVLRQPAIFKRVICSLMWRVSSFNASRSNNVHDIFNVCRLQNQRKIKRII